MFIVRCALSSSGRVSSSDLMMMSRGICWDNFFLKMVFVRKMKISVSWVKNSLKLCSWLVKLMIKTCLTYKLLQTTLKSKVKLRICVNKRTSEPQSNPSQKLVEPWKPSNFKNSFLFALPSELSHQAFLNSALLYC